MPKSQASGYSAIVGDDDAITPPTNLDAYGALPTPSSPISTRRLHSSRTYDADTSRRNIPDEHSSLLGGQDDVLARSYMSVPVSGQATPRFVRQHSHGGVNSVRFPRHVGQSVTFSQRLVNALSSQRNGRLFSYSVLC